MVNTCVAQGCVVRMAKQNVTVHEFPKERARRSLWRRFVQTTRSHWEPTRHSQLYSKHYISCDFVNDVEYQMGYAKKRVISKTAVPTIFPSKVSDSQCSVDGLGGNDEFGARRVRARNFFSINAPGMGCFKLFDFVGIVNGLG